MADEIVAFVTVVFDGTEAWSTVALQALVFALMAALGEVVAMSSNGAMIAAPQNADQPKLVEPLRNRLQLCFASVPFSDTTFLLSFHHKRRCARLGPIPECSMVQWR